MSILQAFGIGVPAWVVEAVAILALAGTAVLFLEHRGAQQAMGKLQKASTALIAAADKKVIDETVQHAADNAANQEKLNAALQNASDIAAERDQRVRDFAAYRRAHADVSRPAGGSGPASGGECGAQSCGDLAVQLAERGNELARSVADLTAALQAAERDRDSLTGLP